MAQEVARRPAFVPGDIKFLAMLSAVALALLLAAVLYNLGAFLMKKTTLLVALAAAALTLSACGTLSGNLGAPTGDTPAALEAYKIYASRCASQFALPWTATVTCERTQAPPQNDVAAQVVKALIDAGIIQKPVGGAPAP